MIVKCNKTDECTYEYNGKHCTHYGNHEYDSNDHLCDVVQTHDSDGCVKGAVCVIVAQVIVDERWEATNG